jgi:hypothetical protein
LIRAVAVYFADVGAVYVILPQCFAFPVRDFLNGVALTTASSLTPDAAVEADAADDIMGSGPVADVGDQFILRIQPRVGRASDFPNAISYI